jgi:hypothetical protein
MVVSVQTQVSNVQLVDSINVEIQSTDAVDEQVIRLGYFIQDNVFVEGEIGVFSEDSDGNV